MCVCVHAIFHIGLNLHGYTYRGGEGAGPSSMVSGIPKQEAIRWGGGGGGVSLDHTFN